MQQQQQGSTLQWVPAYVVPLSSWGSFNGGILTDDQLLELLRKAYPGLWWQRKNVDGTDLWAFNYSVHGRQLCTYSAISPGKEWQAWRYGMYLIYICWQSGGLS